TTTDFSGAVPAYREAIRLDPNYAEAYCNLSQILREQGRFAEALAAIEQGHRLGLARGPKWLSQYPSDKWLKATQWLIVLDANLPRILDGSDQPATVWEHLGYVGVCRVK